MNKLYKDNNKIELLNKLSTELEDLYNYISALDTEEAIYKFARIINKININTKNHNKEQISNQRIIIKNFLYKLLQKKIKKSNLEKENVDISKLFKKNLFSRKKYNILFSKSIYLKKHLGYIPFQFLKNIDKAERNIITRNLLEIFSEYSIILNIKKNNNSKEYFKTNLKLFEEAIGTLILQKAKVKFINSGFFGNAFKITVGKKSFIYKTFFPYKNLSPCTSGFTHEHHGAAIEPINAIFCSNKCKKNFVKAYCSKIPTITDYRSFILTEFLKEKNKIYKKNKLNYLEIRDSVDDNSINGKIIDFGGIVEQNPKLKDKELQKIMRIISQNIKHIEDSENFIITTKISEHNIRELKKLNNNKYKTAIKIYKKKIKTLPYIYNLNNPEKLKPINITQNLDFNSVKNISELINKIDYYKGKILLNIPANPYCKYDGYLILLKNNIQYKFYYKEDDIIYKIEKINTYSK